MDYARLSSFIGKVVEDYDGTNVRITGIGTPGTMFCEPVDPSRQNGPYWIATAYCEVNS